MSKKIPYRQMAVFFVLALSIIGCTDQTGLEEPGIMIDLGSCPPDCGRMPTPDEMLEMEAVIDNNVRACGGSVWETISDDLLTRLYSFNILVFTEEEATDPLVRAYWDDIPQDRIWVSDWHWFADGTLNTPEMTKSLGHEGVHDYLGEGGHGQAFSSIYQTCFAS